MSDISTQGYRPNLPTDKRYLNTIADSISQKERPLEEIHFEYLNEVLLAIGLAENPYDYVSLENNIDNEKIDRLLADSFEKVSNMELAGEVKNKVLRVWDYLAESDPLEKADLIFVFGGGMNRAKAGIDLYLKRYSNKILFTGQKASYMPDTETAEAEQYRQEALKMGVPDKDIIIEVEAINTPENAVKSCKILKEMNFLPEKIILISSEFHMRRGYLTFKAVEDWNAKLIRHAAELADFNRENFYKIKKSWSYMFYEYIKIYYSRLLKHC